MPNRLSKIELAQWRTVINWLRTTFPPAFPVTIRTTRISKRDHGRTHLLSTKRFLILISNHATFVERIDTLLHEWAHALNWSYRHNREGCEHHDESWGVQFAKIYAAYERAFDGD